MLDRLGKTVRKNDVIYITMTKDLNYSLDKFIVLENTVNKKCTSNYNLLVTPLTKVALNYFLPDADVYQEPFTIFNIEQKSLLKIKPSDLEDSEQTLYNEFMLNI
jgi:hypothetical protein